MSHSAGCAGVLVWTTVGRLAFWPLWDPIALLVA